MFSLQKFLGKGDEFFDLFERSAEQCKRATEALKKLLAEPTCAAHLSELRQARQENKRITEEIDQMVVRTLVTVLEREDIEALARVLYKIPKPVEKFAEKFLAIGTGISPSLFNSRMAILETATSTVVRMVQELRKGVNLAKIKGLNSRLQDAEAEADTLELELLKDLFARNPDPLQAYVIADLYDLMEKEVDLCRGAGNVITHIFLKNS